MEPAPVGSVRARSARVRTPLSSPSQVGANQYDLGSFNEATIIETIRRAGTISRTEIAERTGLTQQSVSRILRLLLERGLLAEGASERTERLGKPRTPVRLRPEAGHAVGVVVDPEIVSSVLADLDGRVVARRSVRLGPGTSPDDLVAIIADGVEELVAESDVDPATFLGVGVAVPGPITTDGTLLNLPLSEAWRNVPLRARLAERLAWPVLVEKDGVAAATGERWIGRANRSDDFVYVYFGTGIGSGLILSGEAYRGTSANAGEFGQLCAIRIGRVSETGAPQLVRECNPTASLPEIARERGYAGSAQTYREFCAEIGAGDAAAVAAAEQIADVIAQGAVALIDLLDLPLVVIGGPVFEPEIAPIVLSRVEHAVNDFPTARMARTVVVERSLLQAEAAAIGAASMIFHASFAPSVRGIQRPASLA
nr:ROK family protein [Microbacterium ulmi]